YQDLKWRRRERLPEGGMQPTPTTCARRNCSTGCWASRGGQAPSPVLSRLGQAKAPVLQRDYRSACVLLVEEHHTTETASLKSFSGPSRTSDCSALTPLPS